MISVELTAVCDACKQMLASSPEECSLIALMKLDRKARRLGWNFDPMSGEACCPLCRWKQTHGMIPDEKKA